MPAVKPALDSGWLTVDTAAGAGSGRLPQSAPAAGPAAPQVPLEPSVIPADLPDVAPESGGVLYEPSGWTGAWPGFSQAGWVQGPVPATAGTGNGEPDHGRSLLSAAPGTVQVTEAAYAGHDAHSQATDTAGWQQYTPTGRSAVRRILGSSADGWRSLWYQPAERPVPRRLAVGAVAGPGPAGSGPLPDYADTSMGGPGNIAYSTPGPPATVPPPATPAPAAAWQWGAF